MVVLFYTELGKAPSLEDLRLDSNLLSGSIPTELGILVSSFRFLHLSNNFLTGQIPSELAQLGNLTLLSLGDNDLSGEIPGELSTLVANETLISIHVTGNPLLSGEIPQEMCEVGLGIENFICPGWLRICGVAFDCSDSLCGCDCPC